ncbi:cellulose biosynthesis protein BcsS [Rhodopseudomonas palustris]|uniref:cellulose biosynthesis protein BcsS n=1 Tax=Rhodopseudomonas palustris TaxID=1076 RepID=UPI001F36C0B4|nr:cellulose biosynthesis protein BcsS [Rhodopseudomonas palustris]
MSLIAILVADPDGAQSQTFEPTLDGEASEELPSPAALTAPLGSPAADATWFDPTDDDGLWGDLPDGNDLADLAVIQTGRPSAAEATNHALLFGGQDVWRNGVSLYGGAEWSGIGPAENGWVIRLQASEALERYQTTRFVYVSDISRASVLAGWRFKVGQFELKILAGPDLEHRTSTPDIRDRRWRGSHGGLRIAIEGWAEPTPETMLTYSFYATTVASSYGTRIAAGRRALDMFWWGPEMSGSADEFSRQTRIGLHLSGLRIAALEWSAAAGYVRDSFGRGGVYMRMGAQLRP